MKQKLFRSDPKRFPYIGVERHPDSRYLFDVEIGNANQRQKFTLHQMRLEELRNAIDEALDE